jgi:integrase
MSGRLFVVWVGGQWPRVCERVPLPRIERDEVRFLDPDEVGRLAGLIDGRYRCFVLVGAYGVSFWGSWPLFERTGSTCTVEPLQAAWDCCQGVRSSRVRPSKPGLANARFPRFVVDALAEHLAGAEADDLVFPAPEGGTRRASLSVVERGRRPSKRRGSTGWHRTACGIQPVAFWIPAGASPPEVAARAGHASMVTVLDRYGNLLPKAT